MKQALADWITEGAKGAAANLGKWIVSGVINSSYWICLYVSLVALILYIAGQKKAGKYVSISFVVYFLLQAIKGVIGE